MGFVKSNPFVDEFGEIFKDTGRQMKSLPKDIAKSAKGQIFGASPTQTPSQQNHQATGLPSSTFGEALKQQEKGKVASSKGKNDPDPVTGLPRPSKQALMHLSNAIERKRLSELSQKRRQIEEELAKQRMKQGEEEEGVVPGEGPEIKSEKKKPLPGAVQTMLNNSVQSGEAKGDAIGG